MTEKQEQLVRDLRLKLLRSDYPPIYGVTNEELTAVEQHLEEWLLSLDQDPILLCGEHGLYFKGCQLVLIPEEHAKTEQ